LSRYELSELRLSRHNAEIRSYTRALSSIRNFDPVSSEYSVEGQVQQEIIECGLATFEQRRQDRQDEKHRHGDVEYAPSVVVGKETRDRLAEQAPGDAVRQADEAEQQGDQTNFHDLVAVGPGEERDAAEDPRSFLGRFARFGIAPLLWERLWPQRLIRQSPGAGI
jgi:hypothetical protein